MAGLFVKKSERFRQFMFLSKSITKSTTRPVSKNFGVCLSISDYFYIYMKTEKEIL